MQKSDRSPAGSRVVRETFGQLADGSTVEMVRLRGKGGFEARIITFGAAIQAIFAPDRTGKLADVVLGREDLDGYVSLRRFLGATVGRFANRIAKGSFDLDGQRYQLPTNDGANALHGGLDSFDRKNWKIVAVGEKPVPFVHMSYVSADGEEGYPGTLTTELVYSISGDMELCFAFKAETDKPTVINLTNHSFFNLAGVEADGGGILDHRIMVAADNYLPVNADGIPRDVSPVDTTPFDFRHIHRVGVRIHDDNEQLHFRKGYDHCYCLRGGAVAEPRLAARVEEPRSGRALELLTNQPGVQFYSGNFLNGSVTGKYGRVYRQYDALCLEPQVYPNSPNRPDFPSSRLDPGQTYLHKSVFRFSTI
jgi:aldose 1-epimerase